ADVGRDLPGDAVGDRARDLAGDQLTRAQTLAASARGPEDLAQDASNLADPASRLRSVSGVIRGGRFDAFFQDLVSRFRIDGGIVFAFDRALRDRGAALLRAYEPQTRRRRTDHRALDHGGNAVAFEERHQRLALAEFGDDLGGIESLVRPKGFGSGPH